MATLSDEIRKLVGIDKEDSASLLREKEISEDVAQVLEKMLNGREPNKKERKLLISPIEAAAVLSVRDKRTVNHRYIKELSRTWKIVNGEKVPVEPKIKPVRTLGKANIYLLGNIYDKKRKTRKPNDQKQPA